MKVKEQGLPYCLPIAGGRTDGFMLFPMVFSQSETQTTSSKIGTQVADSLFYNNRWYAKCTHLWVNSRQTGLFSFGTAINTGEEKLRIQTSWTLLKNWPCVEPQRNWVNTPTVFLLIMGCLYLGVMFKCVLRCIIFANVVSSGTEYLKSCN